jgi:hypothetical protein
MNVVCCGALVRVAQSGEILLCSNLVATGAKQTSATSWTCRVNKGGHSAAELARAARAAGPQLMSRLRGPLWRAERLGQVVHRVPYPDEGLITALPNGGPCGDPKQCAHGSLPWSLGHTGAATPHMGLSAWHTNSDGVSPARRRPRAGRTSAHQPGPRGLRCARAQERLSPRSHCRARARTPPLT